MDPKTQASIEVLKSLRQETLVHMAVMDLNLLFYFGLMVLLIAAGQFSKQAFVLAAVVGATLMFAIARQEVKLHRTAPAVQEIESELGIKGWENYYKPKTAGLTSHLVALDGVLILFVIALFGYAVHESGKYLERYWTTTVLFWSLFTGGAVWLVRVLVVAKSLLK